MHKEKQHRIFVGKSLYEALAKRRDEDYKGEFVRPSKNAYIVQILSGFLTGKLFEGINKLNPATQAVESLPESRLIDEEAAWDAIPPQAKPNKPRFRHEPKPHPKGKASNE